MPQMTIDIAYVVATPDKCIAIKMIIIIIEIIIFATKGIQIIMQFIIR